MRATGARLSKATRPLLQSASSKQPLSSPPHASSSSTPAPSQRSKTYPDAFLPNGQASASTLRSLISLHHSASSFMHDPSELPSAFQTAFRKHQPSFQSFSDFSISATEVASDRGSAGLENLVEKGHSSEAVGARRRKRYSNQERSRQNLYGQEAFEAMRPTKEVFRSRERQWTNRRDTVELTEREMQVREALFGTWERKAHEAAVPNLEGMVEILEARGLSVEESAKAWRERNKDAEETGTEDGQ